MATAIADIGFEFEENMLLESVKLFNSEDKNTIKTPTSP